MLLVLSLQTTLKCKDFVLWEGGLIQRMKDMQKVSLTLKEKFVFLHIRSYNKDTYAHIR